MENITHGRRFIDLTGRICGYALVLWFHSKNKHGASRWWCRCTLCGTEFAAWTANLLRPDRLNSCGCKLREVYAAGLNNRKHGDSSRKSLYRKTWTSWIEMRRRVLDISHKRYPYYGGRGIRICAAFLDYALFKPIIGACPPDKWSLGRINNEGHYSCGACDECRQNGWPKNVRWESQEEQMNNTRASLKFHGKSVAELADEAGKPISVMRQELGLRVGH